jgi:RimJ/RimL family protein N-acetyltransferase
MSLAAWPVARIPQSLSPSFLNKSQLACGSSLFIAIAILETSRLTLRTFRERDVDLLFGLRVAEKIRMSLEKQIIYRRFLTNVFFLSRARWEKESAA